MKIHKGPFDQPSRTGVQKQVLLDVRCEHLLHQARLGSRLLLEMTEEAAKALLLVQITGWFVCVCVGGCVGVCVCVQFF